MTPQLSAQIQEALAAGYAPGEVVNFLAKGEMGSQVSEALANGHSPDAILTYLAKAGAAPAAPPPPPPSMLETAGQYAGLAGRAAVQAAPSAVFGLPALAMDAYGSLQALAAKGANELFPTLTQQALGRPAQAPEPWAYTKMLTQSGEQLANAMGLPQPQTEAQQSALTYGTPVLSALGGAAAAGRVATQVAGTSAAPVLTGLAEGPVQQAVGVGASTGMAQYLAQHPEVAKDLGETGSMLAILGTGSLAPAAAGNVTNRALTTVKPITEAGQRAIAGGVLGRLATDRERALTQLSTNQRELLPGSRMTTGEVAGDAGLAGAQQPILKAFDEQNKAGQLASQRNEARVNEFNRLSGGNVKWDARDLLAQQAAGLEARAPGITGEMQMPQPGGAPLTTAEYAAAKRDLTGAGMREDIFGAPAKTAALEGTGYMSAALNEATRTAVGAVIDGILAGPKGTRSDVQTALKWAAGRLQQNIDSPERLYSIRKDLRDASVGRYSKDVPSLALAKGELERVIQAVDNVIEASAPGYMGYMRKYAQASKAIDQMEVFNHLRRAAESAQVDATQSGGAAKQFPIMMTGKLQSAIETLRRTGQLDTLSVTQRRVLDKVFADIRSETSLSSGSRITRQPGSDTFKNMTMANIVGQVVGDYLGSTKAAQSITAPFQWLYKIPESNVQALLVDAMLDPQLARQLLSEASSTKVLKMSEALQRRAVAAGLIQSSQQQLPFGQ
jgi:hypothetical protein